MSIASWSGPIPSRNVDWELVDDETKKPVGLVKGAGTMPPAPNTWIPNVGDCKDWVVTSVSGIEVDMTESPPKRAKFIVQGHCLPVVTPE